MGEPEQVGFLIGKEYRNMKELTEKCELAYARFDDSSSSIELCGLSAQVEAAKMMIMVHRDYLPVYRDMGQERDEIQAQFAELDGQDFKGKGKKGKGKDKKGEQASFQQSDPKAAGKGKEKDKGKDKGKGKDEDKGKGKDEDKDKGKDKGKGKEEDKGKDKGKGNDEDK